jgi:hypothetical protein
MAKRCPSCRTEVADNVRDCPNCPWSFPEQESNDPPSAAIAPGWSPLPLAVVALIAALIGAGWYFVGKVYREEMSPESKVRPPSAAVPAPPASEPEPSKPAAPAFNEQEDKTVTVVKEPPRKRAKPVKEWKLRGYVYDLVTLQPVPHCKIILSDLETNAHLETATDAGGRYRAILPPLPGRGYLVEISASGYAAAYLNPGTEGVPNKPLGERQGLCRELGTAVLQPASLEPHAADPLVTDFYIAPVSCR